MEINYIETPKGEKLFSFFTHDLCLKDGIFIDGGFDYTRVGGDNIPEVKTGSISDLIKDIREKFTWGKNYEKDGTPLPKTEYIKLKDITTSHIVGILLYFTKRLAIDQTMTKQWISIHQIFLEELNYRNL